MKVRVDEYGTWKSEDGISWALETPTQAWEECLPPEPPAPTEDTNDEIAELRSIIDEILIALGADDEQA